jgi:hypothetical protein
MTSRFEITRTKRRGRGQALFFVSLMSLFVSTANASETRFSAQYQFESSSELPDCPDRGRLLSEVEGRLGFQPFSPDAPQQIRVRIWKEGDRHARVERLNSEGEVLGEKKLSSRGSDCSELEAALVLAISMAVDPLSFRAGASGPQKLEAVAEPQPTEVKLEPETPLPSNSLLLHWEVGAGSVAGWSASAAWLPSLWIYAGAGGDRFSLGAEGRFELPMERVAGSGRVRSMVMLGTLTPCLRASRLGACALLSGGALSTEGIDLVQPEQTSSLLVAIGGRFHLDLWSSPSFSIRAFAQCEAILTRTTVIFTNGEAIWTTAPMTGGLGLAVFWKTE